MLRTTFLLSALVALSQTPDWRNGIARVEASGKSPGTGFVVALRSDRAYIITCAHVVEGDPHPTVTFNADPDKRRYQSEIRNSDRRNDLALLAVDNPPANIGIVEPRPGSTTEGTDVSIAGYPSEEGARFSVRRGSVSSVSGTEFSVSPAADEGFSGGPVMADGRVIGVVFEHTRAVGKAVPAAIVNLYLGGLEVRWGSEGPKPPEPRAESASPSVVPAGTVRTNGKDGLKYVWIPPGKFMMGCSPGDSECSDDEPPHEAAIPRGFWMGQTEVTQTAYERVMGTNPSEFKGAQRPVETVTWNEASDYCEKVGLRLPTETEWEYAARAGSPDARYGELDSIAWYWANSSKHTHNVAQKQPNGWGLYDMLGNVYEWTSDLYPGTTFRILRGGSWVVDPQYVRVSYRGGVGPAYRYNRFGFRCAGELR